MTGDLLEAISDEADLCRNEGAEDIAELLDKAKAHIEALTAKLERAREEERERCAKIAESHFPEGFDNAYRAAGDAIARKIRSPEGNRQ